MGDNYELRKEIARLQAYVEDLRRKHNKEVETLRQDLIEEQRYSKRLRTELDDEYAHCERLRRDLDSKRRYAQDLADDLADERHYSAQLERRLDKRGRQVKKLEEELHGLEDDYKLAYRELKRMDSLRRDLENTKILRLFEKEKTSRLQEEVLSLRGSVSPRTRSSLTPSASTSSRTHSPDPSTRATTPRASPLSLQQPEPVASEYEDDADDASPSDLDEAAQDEVEDLLNEEAEEQREEEEDPDAHEDTTPGQKLRALANREGRLAEREFQRAKQAYTSGDKAFAKKLKDRGTQHRAAMKNYHRMAAAEIFNHHNPDYHSKPRSRERIDLHRLHVAEAREFVERHIELCSIGRLQRTEVIVGRGAHSVGGVPRLRPAILELLESMPGVVIDTSNTNPGCIIVEFGDLADEEPSTSAKRHALPRHAEVEDVFEESRTRLRAAKNVADDLKRDIDELERGVNAMRT